MSWRSTLNLGKLFLGNQNLETRAYEVVATPGAEAANAIDVSVQLNDPEGNALETSGLVNWYISDDVNGAAIAAAAPSGGVAGGAAGDVTESLANLIGAALSNGVGVFNIILTEATAKTFYLVVETPCGVRKIIPVVFA